MKYLFLFFLVFTNFVHSSIPKIENREPRALTGLNKFEVITFFSPYDKINQDMIYGSIIDTFKKSGKITVSESESLITNLLQTGTDYPICFFSISRKQDFMAVSLEVHAEAEVVANKYKTTCSIWKKTLFSPVIEKEGQEDIFVSKLMEQLIQNLTNDWAKDNKQEAKDMYFHIRQCKSL